jgi:FK506-binding protein 8
MKKILQYGDGDDFSSRPKNGQVCVIYYDAFLYETSKLVEHEADYSFILGDGDVISAIDLVVSLMTVNEKCEIITEARHAYGSIGR